MVSTNRFIPAIRISGNIIVVLLVATAAASFSALVYSNSRAAYFTSDDFVLLDAARSDQTASSLFLANWLKQEGQGGFYRPLVILSWMMDWALHADAPLGYHLTNIALHSLNVFLIVCLIQRITGSLGLALSTSLLYSAHPALTEAVAWLSGRTDSLCAAFILLSLLSWRFYLDHGHRLAYAAALAAFTLALMSKEEAVALPFLALLLARVRFSEEESKHYRRFIDRPAVPLVGYFLLLGIYIVFRFIILGGIGGYGVGKHLAFSADLFQNIRRYVNWLAQPLGIGPRSGDGFLALMAAVVALTLWLIWRPRTRFATLWTVIALAPAITLSRPQYLYVPAIGYCLLLSLAFFPEGEPLKRRLLAVLALCSLLFYFTVTVRSQNRAWNRSGGTALGTLRSLEGIAPSPAPNDRWFFLDLPFNQETGFGVFQNGLQQALHLRFGEIAPQAVKLARPEELTNHELSVRDRVFKFSNGRLDDVTPRFQPGITLSDVPLRTEGALTFDGSVLPVSLSVTPPIRAHGLELHSLTANSFNLEQGHPIANISLRDEFGRELTSVEVLIGHHTAEWAIDRGDIKGKVPHQRPAVASAWFAGVDTPDPQPGYVYRARWLWDQPLTVGELVITFHALPGTERNNVVWEIRRIALEYSAKE